MKAHRISLDVFGGLDGEWVDIHDRRTFGARLAVTDAQIRVGELGLSHYNVTRMQEYVQAWSFEQEFGEDAIKAMDDDVATYVLEQAEEHYQEGRRTPAARKSAAGEAGAGLRIARVLAGDGPQGGQELAS